MKASITIFVCLLAIASCYEPTHIKKKMSSRTQLYRDEENQQNSDEFQGSFLKMRSNYENEDDEEHNMIQKVKLPIPTFPSNEAFNVDKLLKLPAGKGFVFTKNTFDANQIHFLFYNRTLENASIGWKGQSQPPSIDVTKKTKFIIHGWLEDKDRPWYRKLTHAFLKEEDVNVIQVDWSSRAQQIDYYGAAQDTKQVGNIIGDQIVKLGLDLQNVHVVGHSLGAQTAGFVGKYVKERTGSLIKRITALDAARPLFENNDKEDKLYKNDAEFVDAIHTDSGVLGCLNPIGNADIYVNKGVRPQPGCKLLDLKTPLGLIFSCSHARSVDLFWASINSHKLVAVKCNSYDKLNNRECEGNEKAVMGLHMPVGTNGIFFVSTTSDFPYNN